MKKNKVSQSLYRFKTYRAPELIEEDQITNGFVKHPNEASGSFLLLLTPTQPILTPTILEQEAISFKSQAFKKRSDVKALGRKLFNFSTWLIRNRTTLTKNELISKISKLSVLNNSKKIRLWDNLFYQIVTHESGYVRDNILSLLVADFVVSKVNATSKDILDTQDDNDFRRLAQARVIIPNAILGKKTDIKRVIVPNIPNVRKLEADSKLILSKQRITKYQRTLNEITKYQKKYNVRNLVAYEAATKEHENKIGQAYKDATIVSKEISTKEIESVVDQIEYVDLVLPTFDYVAPREIDEGTIDSLLSESARDTMRFFGFYDDDTVNFESVKSTLKKHIDDEYNSVFRNSIENGPSKKVLKNGSIITPAASGGLKSRGGGTGGGGTVNSSDTYLVSTTVQTSTTISSFNVLLSSLPNGSDIISMTLSGTTDMGDNFSTSQLMDTPLPGGNLNVLVSGLSINILNVSTITFSVTFTLADGGTVTISNGAVTVNVTTDIQYGHGYSTDDCGAGSQVTTYDLSGQGFYSYTGPQVDDGSGDDGSGGNTDTGTGTNPTSPYIPTGYGIRRLGIEDYRKIEQEICCYVPGEVSHIENIMAREYKDKTTTRFVSKTDTSTFSEDTERERLTDTTSTDRFEMQSQISSIINEDKSIGLNAQASYESKFGLSLSAGADFAYNTSKEESNNQALNHAQELTERALDRIISKVSEERTQKVVEEFEERSSHGFDNRKGETHVSGVYRWVDKIYRNKIINYGKRLMYEFMIPEPASFHHEAIRNVDDIVLQEPMDPRKGFGSMNMATPSDVTEAVYQHWAGLYNAEVNPMPKDELSVSKSLKATSSRLNGEPTNDKYYGVTNSIDIPEGYYCNSAKSNAQMMYHLTGNEYAAAVNIVGNISQRIPCIATATHSNGKGALIPASQWVQHSLGKDHTGSLAISSMFYDAEFEAVSNFTLDCQLTQEAYKKWQIETFNTIITAYEDVKAEYERKLEELKAMLQEKRRTNPYYNRETENILLRKNCIAYLIDNANLGQDLIEGENSLETIRPMYTDESLDAYVSKVKFFEQAFEWNLMSYNFYPFYWANKEKWRELYLLDDDDPLFRNFLRAGMARVIVTVRPGFEEAVNWYMATGQVWNGGQVPISDDELFISIIEELREPIGEIEETWETRIPTNLTIIQAGSIGLQVEGLPCDTDCDDWKLFDSDGSLVVDEDGNPVSVNPIVQTNNLISGSEASEGEQDSDVIIGAGAKKDDLRVIEGIGSKIAELLIYNGIDTWEKLSKTDGEILHKILNDAIGEHHVHAPDSWPEQADLAFNGEWEKLIDLQKDLNGK